MNTHIKLLKNSALMNGLSYHEICSYLQTGKFKIATYNKNSFIHFEGEECSKAELVLSGEAGIIQINESGDMFVVSEITNDNIIGGNILFAESPYYVMSMIALTPIILLEIDKEVLFHLLCSNSSFLSVYLRYISNHTLMLGSKITSHFKKTMRERILSFVIDECKKQNSDSIKLPITKKALAERIGVQRTSLSRELAKMRKDGLISYDAEFITLLEREH